MSNESPKTKKISTNRLVAAALFAALSLAVKPFEIYLLPVARVNFVGVPIIMAGIILGPVWGGAVGFVADVAGYLLMDKTGMAINPILTLANIMLGVIPGLVFHLKKSKSVKKSAYAAMDMVSYIVLLALAALLMFTEGSLKLEGGALSVLSPSSGEWSVVPWLYIIIIGAGFVLYSVALIFLFRKRSSDEKESTTLAGILFAVTGAIIIGDIIISGLGLAVMYGWPMSLMLIVRIIKGFVIIPVYTLLCSVIYKAAKHFKF